jgi:hypothetical protein
MQDNCIEYDEENCDDADEWRDLVVIKRPAAAFNW